MNQAVVLLGLVFLCMCVAGCHRTGRRQGSVTSLRCTLSWLPSVWQGSYVSGDGPTQNHSSPVMCVIPIIASHTYMLLAYVYSAYLYASTKLCAIVPMPVLMFRANIRIFRTNTEQISVKFGEVSTATNRWTDYIFGKIVSGTRERDTTENSKQCQPLLPHSKRLHRFYSIHTARRIRRAGDSITRMPRQKHRMIACGL